MTFGNLMEEAGDEQEPSVDRALSDAAKRADPVPAAVVDAAKQAYEERGRVADTAEPSADDETTEPAAPTSVGR